MILSPHFSLAEFVASAKALQLGLDNSLPDHLLPSARQTAEMLERVRSYLSKRLGRPVPLLLSSGYRCLLLNKAVGSEKGSDHVKAMAADWSAPAFGSPVEICRALAPQISTLGIGQLIYECPAPGRQWVHTSTRVPERLCNRVITIARSGPVLGIREGA